MVSLELHSQLSFEIPDVLYILMPPNSFCAIFQPTAMQPLECGYATDPAYGDAFTYPTFLEAFYTCNDGYT